MSSVQKTSTLAIAFLIRSNSPSKMPLSTIRVTANASIMYYMEGGGGGGGGREREYRFVNLLHNPS